MPRSPAGWARRGSSASSTASRGEQSDESTAALIEAHRGAEILGWVEAQAVKPRALAVLDDLDLRGAIAPVLVRTVEEVGLTDADVERVVKLLTARRPLKPWEPAKVRKPRARRVIAGSRACEATVG